MFKETYGESGNEDTSGHPRWNFKLRIEDLRVQGSSKGLVLRFGVLKGSRV